MTAKGRKDALIVEVATAILLVLIENTRVVGMPAIVAAEAAGVVGHVAKAADSAVVGRIPGDQDAGKLGGHHGKQARGCCGG